MPRESNSVIMTLNVCTFQWKFPSLFDADDYLFSRFGERKIQLEHNCKFTRINSLRGLQAGVCLTTVTCPTRRRSKSLPDLLTYFSTDDASTK